ncbi:uncharacterized protein, partial [Halyomorpha halys]|uniref:uncharacterized protein n=1 Tax=Halyomorpha halys TaxID=286706 RepID=UPI0034D23AAB
MVLLGTVCILVKSKGGELHITRAVLNSGSQYTFISSVLAHKIGAKITNFDHCMTSLCETAVPRSHLKGSTYCTNCVCSLFSLTKSSIEDHVKAFWEPEEPTTIDRSHSDDVQCEQHFVQTHRHTVKGRYVVRLPFISESLELDYNKSIELRRFFSLESKCHRNQILAKMYKAFMEEYLALEHLSPVLTHSTYIIPHHGVWQEQLNGPKHRVVFDTSCRSTRHSLNDFLHSGNKLQRDLAMILIQFRLYAVAVCADIVKIYRQIIMPDDDRKYQLILWSSDTSEAIQEFELNTVSYGIRSSTYQALRVVQQLAENEGSYFPLASKRVPCDMYVVYELMSQLGASKGGFSL